jgi:hypothetical protein
LSSDNFDPREQASPPHKSKVKLIIIIVAAVFGAFIMAGVVMAGFSASLYNFPSPVPVKTDDREVRIAAMLGDERAKDPAWRNLASAALDTENRPNALVQIASDTSWRGARAGTDLVTESVDGSGFRQYQIVCEPDGVYSVNFQKDTSEGFLNVYVAYDGKIIKQGQTTAEFGLVALAGRCN